ncbi:MAG: glycosyltransferase [Elusimicrobiales bacterium]|nr:glycosyltransferase [Elusimicrobiales bacterium]
MTKKLFITLFPEFNLVLSNKDVGAIPYHFGRTSGWRGGVLYVKSDAIPPTPEYSEQVELYAVEPSRFRPWTYVRLLLELGRMSGGIDVLNIYHGNFFSLLAASVYKLLNPKGLVYCKLDMSHLELELILKGPAGAFASLAYRLKRFLKYCLSSAVDFFSVEAVQLAEELRGLPFYKNRIYYIPNGFCPGLPINIEDVIEKKENIVATIGRLGSYPKNTELFLKALTRLNPSEAGQWKFLFVGEATKQFNGEVEEILRINPWLRSSISLAGQVNDRSELFKIYSKAKYICMPSRWESFCLVILEGMYFGCLPIATGLPSVMDMTNKGELGYVLKSDNEAELVGTLRSALAENRYDRSRARLAHEIVETKFNWQNICAELERIMEKYAC